MFFFLCYTHTYVLLNVQVNEYVYNLERVGLGMIVAAIVHTKHTTTPPLPFSTITLHHIHYHLLQRHHRILHITTFYHILRYYQHT